MTFWCILNKCIHFYNNFFSIIFLSFWFNYFFNSLLWSSLSHCKYYNSIFPHQKMTGICVVHCMEKNRLQLPPVSPVDTKVIFYLHSPSHSHHFEFYELHLFLLQPQLLSYPFVCSSGLLVFLMGEAKIWTDKMHNYQWLTYSCGLFEASQQCSGNNLAVSLLSCLKYMKLSEKQKRVSTWPKTTLGTAGVRCSWKEEEGRKKERRKANKKIIRKA